MRSKRDRSGPTSRRSSDDPDRLDAALDDYAEDGVEQYGGLSRVVGDGVVVSVVVPLVAPLVASVVVPVVLSIVPPVKGTVVLLLVARFLPPFVVRVLLPFSTTVELLVAVPSKLAFAARSPLPPLLHAPIRTNAASEGIVGS